ncbi:MAG: hypothetical protein LIO50_02615 [Phascolarctobacterium sp.]|uniref:hypothetical protein n=1 Tax=Phascolarctobacterium sp. TaxID=2049039 RepID=UPI0025F78103|nr:hypothetical protein [Phascolarctobacterium sp.]MCC8158105.1 hypothetical protein [Phascolarctobacterium sp.]
MGQLKLTEIEAQLNEWEFLKELPPEIDGFKLTMGQGIDGQILTIASYGNEAMHSKLDLVYTSETFDYVPVKTIGMHTFRDIRYFCRDRDKFAKLMQENLPELLADIDREKKHRMGTLVEETGLASWEYAARLPQKVGGFELFIAPDNPIDYINGSTLFIDYSDFEHGNQLVFFYNTFRDEFFAETKKGFMTGITHEFDCRNLEALEKLLDENLEAALQKLGKA